MWFMRKQVFHKDFEEQNQENDFKVNLVVGILHFKLPRGDHGIEVVGILAIIQCNTTKSRVSSYLPNHK